MPGKWQRVLLDALKAREIVVPTWHAAATLKRRLTRSEHSALNRAAHQLAAAGLCDLGHTYSAEETNRRLVLIVGRPGSEKVKALNVERVPGGTRSTFQSSLRNLAAYFQVSVSTIRRDLASAEVK